MFGLFPVSGTQQPLAWNDGGYKFYFTGTTVYGGFPTPWTFSQTRNVTEEYKISINTSGIVTVFINNVQKASFQGANTDYRLTISSYSTPLTFTDIVLSDNANPTPIYTCVDLDTDKDGVPNRLDLDSDGDGCSDASEAGTVKSLTATTVAGAYGANGFANSIETGSETGVYSGTYSYGNATNLQAKACLDTDADGVRDLDDLDDDNDGILDTVECPVYVESNTCNNWISPTNGTTGTLVTSTGQVVNYSISANSGVTYRSLVGADSWTTTMQCNQPLPGAGRLSNFTGAAEFTITFDRPVSNVQILTSATETGSNEGLIITSNSSSQQTVSVNCSTANQSLVNNLVNQTTVIMTGNNAVIRTVKDASYTSLNVKATNNAGGLILSLSLCSLKTLFTCDTDGDGIQNQLDLDSDGDGCSDANEYYNSSTAQGTDGNRYYGFGNPPATSSDGKVTGASYTGSYSNVISIGSGSVITVQPVDRAGVLGASSTFSATVTPGSGTTSYQWQISSDGGATWTNTANSGTYTGTTTTSLQINSVTGNMNNHRFRLQIKQSNYICGDLTSNVAKLTIALPTILDDEFTTLEDVLVTGSVFTNDVGTSNSTLIVNTFTISGFTFNAGTTATITNTGTIQLNSNGSFTFTPDLNYNGSVPIISYKATDASGAYDFGDLKIIVTPDNDAPTATSDNKTTAENTSVNGTLSFGDADQGASPTLTSVTIGGSTTYIVAGNTPTSIKISEGTLSIQSNGTYTFTPATNFSGGVPTITYSVSDGTASVNATLNITVTPVNDAPVALPDVATVLEDTPVSGNVLTNDSDVDSGTLTVTSVT
ncbi:MAG: Ig-like domain-containing protein, partial [Bacteroidota bacterium]